MSPLQSSSLTSSNGTGNADTHFISNLVSSKGLLNARVKLNRPFIAAMLETCSEIAKFGTALAVSSYLGSYKTDLKQRNSLLVSFGLVLLPMALIMLQPDAGSVIIFLSFSILFKK